MKCIVLNCENHDTQGAFEGTLCVPCFNYITTGEGKHSQMYRNSIAQQVAERMEDKPYRPVFPREGAMRFDVAKQIAEIYINGAWGKL